MKTDAEDDEKTVLDVLLDVADVADRSCVPQ